MNDTLIDFSSLQREQSSFRETVKSLWLVLCAIMVGPMMQLGFAMLEAGQIRTKNVKNILLKNTIDVSLGALGYLVVGYSLAFGNEFVTSEADSYASGISNGFMGYGNYLLTGNEVNAAHFFFHWSFAATASTILSGSLCERAHFTGYRVLSIATSSIIYPLVTHWVWSHHGWLNALGYVDFAGASCVHMVGGLLALTGSYIMGPRIGRFELVGEGKVDRFSAHRSTASSTNNRAPARQNPPVTAGRNRLSKNLSNRRAAGGSAASSSPLPLPRPQTNHKHRSNSRRRGQQQSSLAARGPKSTSSTSSTTITRRRGLEKERLEDRVNAGEDIVIGGAAPGGLLRPLGVSSSSASSSFPALTPLSGDGTDDLGASAISNQSGADLGIIGLGAQSESLMPLSSPRNTHQQAPSTSAGSSAAATSSSSSFHQAPISQDGNQPEQGSFNHFHFHHGSVGGREGHFDVESPFGFGQQRVGPVLANIIPPHAPLISLLGTFLLWFGWYGFNCGSVPGELLFLEPGAVGRTAINTTLCGCTASLVTLTIVKWRSGKHSLGAAMNGLLAGLVSSTAVAELIDPWLAVLVGVGAALVYLGSSLLLIRFRIDDPLDAAPVHYFCGLWSVICSGLFARSDTVLHLSGVDLSLFPEHSFGLFMGGGWRFLGIQLLGAVAISSFVALTSLLLLISVRRCGKLRLPSDYEIAGLDVAVHDGLSYPEFVNKSQ